MCLVKVVTHSNDPVGTRYLELEVGVVGDDHELGVVWLAQDGVVRA
jgi:hypothetical protein